MFGFTPINRRGGLDFIWNWSKLINLFFKIQYGGSIAIKKIPGVFDPYCGECNDSGVLVTNGIWEFCECIHGRYKKTEKEISNISINLDNSVKFKRLMINLDKRKIK